MTTRGRRLHHVLPAAVDALGVRLDDSADATLLGLSPDEPLRAIGVLLVDGLGWTGLRAGAADAPCLSALAARSQPAEVGFPSTTVASLCSLGTGLPPGEHGMLGYTLRLDGGGVTNLIRWGTDLRPDAVQPRPTVFERAGAAGVAVTRVGPASFAGSGLTGSALRGGTYIGADRLGARAAAVLAALGAGASRSGPPALVYAYYGDVDTTGHVDGPDSDAWRHELAVVDRFVERLAAGLPRGTALVVTADHGMVTVDEADKVLVAPGSPMRDGVAAVAGEPRAAYLHTVDGAAADVAATWRATLGADYLVVERDEAVAEGWFGPFVDDAFRARIGDLVVTPVGRGAVYDLVTTAATEPGLVGLRGLHGARTDDEVLVPLLTVAAG